MKLGFLPILLLLAVAGCASPNIPGSDYRDTMPAFTIEEFFDGNVKAWGIVQDRKGRLMQRFTVDINGVWENGTLTLDETFEYGMGEGVTSRVWRIRKSDGNGWTGRADDILDSATGYSFGNAFNWTYNMELPVGDNQYRVSFDDWIWAFDSETIVNRSYIKKFGITFAEVTIFMQKQKTPM